MINVLGVPLYDKTIDDAVATIITDINTPLDASSNRCISATGAHGLVEASKDAGFKAILCNFFINLPDGMPGVWVGRLKRSQKNEALLWPRFF